MTPGKLIYTSEELNELSLHDDHRIVLEEIKNRIHFSVLFDNKPITSGYLALFYGADKIKKNLMAGLIGKHSNKEVYRYDLSAIVSKYIGETEKNLEKIFLEAESKNRILFFDEADALFGKRTNVKDSHDKYANQEVSFLLQRIGDFKGVVILSVKKKENIDATFIRRMNFELRFPMV